MRVLVQKWGNSLALRIPKAAPVAPRRARLEDLLRRVTKRNLQGKVGTGPAVGREAW
jgi:antitoxin component of MazEF toxin-antitoxin module